MQNTYLMKKVIYIVLFTLVGIILQFLVHGILEMWYINLLLSDFGAWGFGLSWEAWVLIHNIGAVIMFIAGAFFGFSQGKYWWTRIYSGK
jgi:hypothetical protein